MTRKPREPPTRDEAMVFAIANTEIEGGHVTDATRDLMSRWAAGSLTNDDLISLGAGNWIAILSTNHGCPQPGERWLIAMPTATTNPHAVGRVVTVVPYPGGAMPRFLLTIAVESDDDAAAREAFPASRAIDCYTTLAEAERWHTVDDEHVRLHGYGRNHWI